jgi:hypothetical protein
MVCQLHLYENGGSNLKVITFDQAWVGTGWTLLEGTSSVTWSGTLDSAFFLVKNNSDANEFYVDWCQLTK